MRTAARVDSNQAEIVRALRQAGCFVTSLAAVGHGVPDLLVVRAGVVHVLEVKDGDKVPSARKLTPDEAAWHEVAAAHGYAVPVVESVADAMRAVGLAGEG